MQFVQRPAGLHAVVAFGDRPVKHQLGLAAIASFGHNTHSIELHFNVNSGIDDGKSFPYLQAEFLYEFQANV
jgi:hypothetical protein